MGWSADFQKGKTAYQNGDFATALREWKSLAEQGNTTSVFIHQTQIVLGIPIPLFGGYCVSTAEPPQRG